MSVLQGNLASTAQNPNNDRVGIGIGIGIAIAIAIGYWRVGSQWVQSTKRSPVWIDQASGVVFALVI